MLLSDAIKSRINYYFNKNNMNAWDLYKASGIPKSTLYSYLSTTDALPKIDTLLHICEGFGITIREFFDDNIFDDTEQD